MRVDLSSARQGAKSGDVGHPPCCTACLVAAAHAQFFCQSSTVCTCHPFCLHHNPVNKGCIPLGACIYTSGCCPGPADCLLQRSYPCQLTSSSFSCAIPQVTTYQHLFVDIDYVPTFRLLKQRYDQTLDGHSNGGNSNGNASADQDRSNSGPASASGGGNGDATAAGGPLAGRRITFQLGSEAAAAAAPVAVAAGRGRGLLGVRRRREDRGLGEWCAVHAGR